MVRMQEKVVDGKLSISCQCRGCKKLCRGLLWRSHGRTFEDLKCDGCGSSWGRVDGNHWHA